MGHKTHFGGTENLVDRNAGPFLPPSKYLLGKDIPSTKKILDQRVQSLETYHTEVLQGIMTLDERGRGLESEMQTVIEKYQ